jgi:hypothetical protein
MNTDALQESASERIQLHGVLSFAKSLCVGVFRCESRCAESEAARQQQNDASGQSGGAAPVRFLSVGPNPVDHHP